MGPRRTTILLAATTRLLAAVLAATPARADERPGPAAPAAAPGAPVAPVASATHGIAMHGDLKYPPGFAHFDYVNPKAPKGGRVRQAAVGTFDSFNPFLVRGNPAAGLSRTWDTLLVSSADEPFSEYGLLAEKVETPPDRSSVTFTLRPQARWHDGRPVTADDVLWSFETLRAKGQPFYRAYWEGVAKAEKLSDRVVRFTFKPGQNRELPLILGQLVVLPKHWWATREFDKTTLEPPLGSGPYRIESFDAGRRVVFRRVPDYWGRELPVNVGRDNFDEIVVDYYRDDTVELEAFKAGEYDVRPENSSKAWATAYDFPAVREGLVKKEEIPHDRPAGMQAFVFNARRPLFRDRRVREALGLAFDFEWSNRTLFFGQYRRSRSFFDNSELAATGLPGPGEVAVLEPLRGKVPDEVFTTEFRPPATDGSGNNREQLKRAVELLREAGWKVDPATKKLVDGNGEPMRFEILLVSPLFERVALPWAKNLERLGIAATVRTVDSAQYRRRLDDFDFDVVVGNFPQSSSPGNEQRSFWGSAFADKAGSDNLIGLRDPAVDALVEQVVSAPDRKSLVDRTRALDRVLQWGHWVVPQWHSPVDRVAWWDLLGQPSKVPTQGYQLDAWWVDPSKAEALAKRRGKSATP
ncbi:extracellular solute-binding protein [bacterium]|nr:extracellular solute-binding protein [bacterium]